MEVQDRQNPNECKTCEKTFKTKKILHDHTKNVHNFTEVKCDVALRLFVQNVYSVTVVKLMSSAYLR